MKTKSWKTTAAGIGTILTAIGGLLMHGEFNATTLSTAFAAIITGIGLLTARDNDKSSEQVGATPTEKPENVTPLPPQN
jgi:hypothetical protein